jgi:uncharacterized protein YbaR (Trm112 family)
MVDKELVDILACPETRQAVKLADAAMLEGVNKAIAAGTCKNKGGEAVSTPLEAGLLREDGKVLYPVRDDIPIMLIDEGIPVG